MLTIEERVFLLEQVFKAGDKYTESVRELFTTVFPETKIPHRDTVRDLIAKFRSTGSVADAPRSGRPSVLSDDKILDISDKMAISPNKSLRRLALESEVSYGTAHTAVKKKLKLFPYKVTAMQELKPTDPGKRLEYCEWFNNFIQQNGIDVLDETFFTDEAWFHLSGYMNSQNSRMWNTENPFCIHEEPLHSAKIGVWIGISRRRIVGPIFFNGTINAQRYCTDILYPFIGELELSEILNGHFQQDSATAHTARVSMALLADVFGDRIISQGLWPPRSPDLTPPDFFFWGAAKATVYKNNPKSIDELKTAISNFTASVTQDMLHNVFANLIRRIELCIRQQGRHFQHLL